MNTLFRVDRNLAQHYHIFSDSSFYTMQQSLNNSLIDACSAGNFENVKSIINTLRSDEISFFGPNGNTALHIAAMNGHDSIVALLIERCCARTFRNEEGKTAYEKAPNTAIKTLLLRPKHSRARFDQKPIFFSKPAFGIWRYIVNPFRLVESDYNEKNGTEERQLCVMNWLEHSLTNTDERNLIVSYFKRAFIEDSTKPILMALTEETSFYNLLNDSIINENEDRVFSKNELYGPLLVARNLFKAVYDGKHGKNYDGHSLFASATLPRAEIAWLKENIRKPPFSLKLFWSVTKNRELAYARSGNAFFILDCKEPTTKRTLCLENLSGYPDEEEVLLAPMTKMEIVGVQRITAQKFEIHISYWDW